ncbi:hypothetical protein O7626_30095 [Micromonospora sp. WMMD1102]|uniref:hypothetical protein n=1 Tax=Micromonospora sp. WMMD1102 TaxID=3016105 RepID=UPI0024152A97|nr:hypothetical protein [Micromonospora sp. WMMD1102]MDG4790123.1 hypothetical protein [Micromonospora sp. WMMD1102]
MTARPWAGAAEPSGAGLWAYVRAAASGDRYGPAGTVAALASLAGSPRLGWVDPPSWTRVARLTAERGGGTLLRGCRRAVFAGTGGWAFGLRAIAEAVPGQAVIRVLDSLDPSTVHRTLAEWGGRGAVAGFAVSASGRTRETRLLAATLALARHRTGGAAPAWLCERGGTLSLAGGRDQVALYHAPLSVPALLAARMLCWPHFDDAYRAFAGAARSIGEWAAEESARLPATGRPRVLFRLPPGAGPGLRLWTLQAARQGWGGKSERFRPWPEVAAEPAPGALLVDVAAGIAGLRRPGGPAGAVAAAMAACYAVAALVACVAVRHGLRFATHDAVDHYKRLLPAAPTAADRPAGARPVGDPDELAGVLAGWLARRPDLTAVHVVGYGAAPAAAIGAERLARRLGRPVEVHEGSAWNHHSYQLVWHTRSVGVAVLLAPERPVGTGNPALDAALAAQRHTLDAIAGATHRSLGPRSLLLHWSGPPELDRSGPPELDRSGPPELNRSGPPERVR